MTDPSLDAARHTFDLLTPLGRGLARRRAAAARLDNGQLVESGWMPPMRWIYPILIGDMSVGALSWRMWEALALAVAYLNEECGLPVRMSSGEGGMPVRLLTSEYLKYFILQIASGHFGWNRIIKAMPQMVTDPAGDPHQDRPGRQARRRRPLARRKSGAAHSGHSRRAARPTCSARPTTRVSTASKRACRRCS